MSNNESDTDSKEGSDGVAAEPLATTRSRRGNAGSLMEKMLQEAGQDEFYDNLYGGFHEEDDDVDFDDEEEADEDEVEDDYDVDSDFSIDETDEIAPEHQAVDEEPKRKRGVYKDPKARGHQSATSSGPSASTPAQSRLKPGSSTPHSPSKIRGERSFRDSTRKKTEETIKNIQTGPRKRMKRRNLEAYKPLTQEELLAEAKKTEEDNIKCLETYQKLESERLKKIKQVEKPLPLPYHTYYSTTMPILGTDKRYTRNFLTFFT